MFWWLVGFPLAFMIIVIVIALLVGRRDRKKQLALKEENKTNLLKNNPPLAVYNYIEQNKEFYEYIFRDVNIKTSPIGIKVDIVYLSTKSIYLIDVVGNEGTINGDVNGEYWVNKTSSEYALKNPLYKDEKTLEIFKNILEVNVNIHHIVIAPNANIANIVNNDKQVLDMVHFFDSIKDLDDIFNDNDLMVYYNSLNNYLERQDSE